MTLIAIFLHLNFEIVFMKTYYLNEIK